MSSIWLSLRWPGIPRSDARVAAPPKTRNFCCCQRHGPCKIKNVGVPDRGSVREPAAWPGSRAALRQRRDLKGIRTAAPRAGCVTAHRARPVAGGRLRSPLSVSRRGRLAKLGPVKGCGDSRGPLPQPPLPPPADWSERTALGGWRRPTRPRLWRKVRDRLQNVAFMPHETFDSRHRIGIRAARRAVSHPRR